MEGIGHVGIHIATTATNTVMVITLTVICSKVNRRLKLEVIIVLDLYHIDNII